jgi:HAD superfamily hydrolase (TIGR01549 family)
MYKAIIFDIDGTLADTNQLILESFNFISLKYLNSKFDFNELTKYFGPPENYLFQQLFKDNFEDAASDYYHFYAMNFHNYVVVFNEIIQAVKLLKNNNIILAIYTGKGNSSTYITLEKLGIFHLFDEIMTGDNLPSFKPNPIGIMNFIEKYNLKNDEVILFGDTLTDIKAAKGAEIPVGIFLWASYHKEIIFNHKPNFVFLTPLSFDYFIRTNYNI